MNMVISYKNQIQETKNHKLRAFNNSASNPQNKVIHKGSSRLVVNAHKGSTHMFLLVLCFMGVKK